MTDRRYNEAEVAAIFERAAEAQQTSQHHLPSGEGMTLTEIQAIGREVGISPEQLVEAAKAIELGGRPTSRRFLGLPGMDDIGFLTALSVLATGGAAMLGSVVLRLPGWARLRRRQMEEVAARAAITAR